MSHDRRTLLASLAASGSVALAGCSALDGLLGGGEEVPADSWPTPTRTATNRTYHAAASGPGESLQERWRWKVDVPDDAVDRKFAYSQPVAHEGTVYTVVSGRYWTEASEDEAEVRYRNRLVAVDVESGDRTFTYEFDVPESKYADLPYPPLVVDDAVLFGIDRFHVVDASNGERRDRFDPDGIPFSYATVADGEAFVPTYDFDAEEHAVEVVDSEKGSTRTISTNNIGPLSIPAVTDDAIYHPSRQEVVAYSRDDGTERWRTTPGADSEVLYPDETTPVHTPVVGDDAVYVATSFRGAMVSDAGALVALDPSDGSERWRYAPEPEGVSEYETTGVYGVPVLHDGTLYAYGARGDAKASEVYERGLYAVNAGDGSLDWRVDVEEPVISPVAADDVLYAFTGETLTAYAMGDGEALASAALEDTTGDSWGANALVGDAFVTATDDGLLAYGPTTA